MNKVMSWIYPILIIGLIAGLLYSIFYKPIKTENNVADILKLEKKKPETYKDAANQNHVTKEVQVLTADNFRLLLQQELAALSAQVKDLKPEDVTGITTVRGEATHTFRPNIKAIEDSLRKVIGHDIEYISPFLELRGSTVPGSPPFKAKYRDSLSLFFKRESYGFLNLKERLTADAYSSNPDMIYSNIRSYIIPQTKNSKSKIGLGVTVGYGVQMNKNTFTHGPQATAGIQFRF